MLERITPEQAGISAKIVKKAIARLEKLGHNFHSVLMMRRGKVFFESYWAPYNENSLNRIYSVTKSFVSVAVGKLAEQGLIDLDKPVVTYFPEYDVETTALQVRRQTVRDMLRMATAARGSYWFHTHNGDRVRQYFEQDGPTYPGGWFVYDSSGSFILGALVERVSGMPLIQYMREYFLDDIGFSQEAKMLLCPGGHSWGDSAMLCTTRDFARFAYFVTHHGNFEGKQLVNEGYMKAAITKWSDPELEDAVEHHVGYGYQIWLTEQNGFSFNGMGGQFAICLPERDFVFVCTSDNQCAASAVYTDRLFRMVFDELVENLSDEALPEDAAADQALAEYGNSRSLRTAFGDASSPFGAKISGKTFVCGENPMGWEKFRITLEEKGGKLEYTNAQGDKELRFGFGENVFMKFPQEGYSDQVGGIHECAGHWMDCAVSAAWHLERELGIFVQIIDEYLGRLSMTFCFPDEEHATICLKKTAEDFLDEYNGSAIAEAE